MTKIGDRQRIILDYARSNKNQITTKQANDLLKHSYYANHEHYVQEILRRLVDSRLLERVARGKYQIKNRVKPTQERGTLFNH